MGTESVAAEVTGVDDGVVVEVGGEADEGAASSEPLRWTLDGGGRAGELLSRSRPPLPPTDVEEVGVDIAEADDEEVANS